VRAWGAGAGGWLGVAIDDAAGDSLFGDERELAVARGADEPIALVSGDATAEALTLLWAGGQLAAADAKALLQEACPPDEALTCDDAALAVPPEQLFDVAVAAYLLESNRSSYELSALSADLPRRAVAGCDHELKASVTSRVGDCPAGGELEQRLDADGSLAVLRTIGCRSCRCSRMERVGVGIDCGVLVDLSADAVGAIDALRRRSTLAGSEFWSTRPSSSPRCSSTSSACRREAHQDQLLDRRLRCLPPLPPRIPSPRKIVAYRELAKLKRHVPRRAAAPSRRGRAAAHVVQPDGGRDRAAVKLEPQPAEHPGAHGVRPADSRGVRAGGRWRRDALGGLQPD
jgi:hypothetical protein